MKGETMRAMRLTAPGQFEMRHPSRPRSEDLATGDVLLRLLAGGICGSDLPYFKGIRTPYQSGLIGEEPGEGFPMHEVVGEVVASKGTALSIGDRVVGWASHYDGLAEYVIARAEELHAYRAELPPERAVLIQPLACVLWAVRQLGTVTGRRAAVLGLGCIGSLFGHVLSQEGARVTGVDAVDRSGLVPFLGLESAVQAPVDEWAASLAEQESFDVVVEAIGHSLGSFHAALAAAAVNGRVYLFGVPDLDDYPLPVADFMLKGLTLISGFTQERMAMLAEADEYLAMHPSLFDLVTDVLPFARTQEAFDRAIAPQTGRSKIVLVMHADQSA
jgi:L-iditol 2-dehydrogenase